MQWYNKLIITGDLQIEMIGNKTICKAYEISTIHFQTSRHDSNLYQVEFTEPHNQVQTRQRANKTVMQL